MMMMMINKKKSTDATAATAASMLLLLLMLGGGGGDSSTANAFAPTTSNAAAFLSRHRNNNNKDFTTTSSQTTSSQQKLPRLFPVHQQQQHSIASSAALIDNNDQDDHNNNDHHHHNNANENRHSASDWLHNIQSLPQSQVLREVRQPVLAVFSWSCAISIIYKVLAGQSSSQLSRHFANSMCIPGTAHSFLVSALGLLLVFRTNSAYQRFNEGRKIWENILSVSRNMSRMIRLYKHDVGTEKLRRLTNLIAAYPYLLRQHIRPGCLCVPTGKAEQIPHEHRILLRESYNRRFHDETRHHHEGQLHDHKGQNKTTKKKTKTTKKQHNHHHRQHNNNLVQRTVLPSQSQPNCWVDKRKLPWSLFLPTSLPGIARAENRPLWVCDRMAGLIAKIPYGPNFTSRERLALLGMVDKLTDSIGQCERIHQTAVPLNYARHSLRSLTLWLFTLPFCLIKDLGLFTPFVNAIVAWLFYGIYQIGYSIEDPFQGSLRLSILCDAIRRNIQDDMRQSAFDDLGDYGDDLDNGLDGSSTFSGRLPTTTPLQFDTVDLLNNAPKLIRKGNGTWTEVGI